MKVSLFQVLPLIAVVTAAPVEIQSRDISQDIFNNLLLFSQYCAATYCTNNNVSPNKKISCINNACPLVDAANTTSSAEFQHTPLTDTTGFVTIDYTRKMIVVAFRGTQAIQNFIDDVTFAQIPVDLCLGCLVHRGFWNSWLEIRETVLTAVSIETAEHPDFQVVVAGHSLGGAIASITAATLRKAGTSAALYTYGSPRVGNTVFASFVTTQAGGNYRVTHTDDAVPKLPPIGLNFEHVSPEYHIEQGDTGITPEDINVYPGQINFQGNTGTLFPNVTAHLYYFANIGACSPGIGVY